MKATLVDGRKIANKLIEEIRTFSKNAAPKKVCFVSFGNDPASRSFVEKKINLAKDLGILAESIERNASSTEEAVNMLNTIINSGYDGIVVQLPVMKPLETNVLLNTIPQEQDIDMLGIEAKKTYDNGETERTPPVARAVQEILEAHNILLASKKIVLLGFGRLVGNPVGSYFNKIGAKYEALDKNTSEEHKISSLQDADIIVSGIGVPHYVRPNMIKEGVVLIDAGTSGEEGKLSGDVDPSCESRASIITPVPGGVGPITVASLFYNLYLK